MAQGARQNGRQQRPDQGQGAPAKRAEETGGATGETAQGMAQGRATRPARAQGAPVRGSG